MEGGLEEELLLVETQLLDFQDQIEALLEQRDRLQNRQSHLRSLLHELQQSEDVSTEDADAPHTPNDNPAAPREVPAEYWSGILIAKDLLDRGISADFYHADMDLISREEVHLRWSKSELQVIIAMVAFGMGINKPDVRFVIHHTLSKSMETYYQESGRAGRDGLPSECVLYYRPGDVPRQSSMVFYENSGLQNLYDMVRYCQSKKVCRRSAFFRHFNETARDCNGMCDNCAYGFEIKEIDCSYQATVIVSLLQQIKEINQKATILQLVDKFKSKIKELGQSKELASDLKREEIEQLIVQLVMDRILKEEFQHTAYSTNAYVTLGPLSEQVLDGKRRVKLETRTYGHVGNNNGTAQVGNNTGSDKGAKRKRLSGLEKKLDELRSEISSQHGGIAPHSILSLQHISVLSNQRPTSLDELEKLIGKVKTKEYGAQIIQVIQKYVTSEMSDGDEKELHSREKVKQPKKGKAVVVVESSEEDN